MNNEGTIKLILNKINNKYKNLKFTIVFFLLRKNSGHFSNILEMYLVKFIYQMFGG